MTVISFVLKSQPHSNATEYIVIYLVTYIVQYTSGDIALGATLHNKTS